ncbi:DUF6585 family protein [Streptomyces olivoreticuli]
MTGPTRRTRSDELLLARISAAAGREHLGRRRATYAGAAHTAHARAPRDRGIRGLLAFVRYGMPSATNAHDDARLDLYDHGMTVAVKGRIHVVRYDTTSVFQTNTPHSHDAAHVGTAYTLTDVDGERIVLRGRPEHGDAAEWRSEIQSGVTRAQLPRALAALDKGERLTFGGIWLTREEIGYGEARARWPQVRNIWIRKGAVKLDIDGTWHEPGSRVSEIPNLFLLRALVELFHRDVNGSV